MDKKENVKWLIKSIFDITNCSWTLKYVHEHIYMDVQLPMCALDYGYEIGADAILSMNMMGGNYEVIKPGVVCGLWFWVSVEGEVIDTFAAYIKPEEPKGEVIILTKGGELVASCIRQFPGTLELFLKGITKDNEVPGAGSYFWRNNTTYDFEIPPPQRYSGKSDLREKGVVSVPKNFLKNLSNKRGVIGASDFGDVYLTALKFPMTFIFSGIGCLSAAAIPVLIIPMFIVMHLAMALVITIFSYLSDCFTKDSSPECPENLKELAYLYSIGYDLPMSPQKEKEYEDKNIRLCGFLKDLDTWEISDYEKMQLIFNETIPVSIARRFGMEENKSWDWCYYKITGKKILGGAPYPYERRT